MLPSSAVRPKCLLSPPARTHSYLDRSTRPLASPASRWTVQQRDQPPAYRLRHAQSTLSPRSPRPFPFLTAVQSRMAVTGNSPLRYRWWQAVPEPFVGSLDLLQNAAAASGLRSFRSLASEAITGETTAFVQADPSKLLVELSPGPTDTGFVTSSIRNSGIGRHGRYDRCGRHSFAAAMQGGFLFAPRIGNSNGFREFNWPWIREVFRRRCSSDLAKLG